jgi:hypothetical protein
VFAHLTVKLRHAPPQDPRLIRLVPEFCVTVFAIIGSLTYIWLGVRHTSAKTWSQHEIKPSWLAAGEELPKQESSSYDTRQESLSSPHHLLSFAFILFTLPSQPLKIHSLESFVSRTVVNKVDRIHTLVGF